MSRSVWVVLGVVIAAAAGFRAWYVQHDAREPRLEIRRDAFVVPQPTDEEKNAFLFDLFRSGRSLTIGRQNFPIWRIVGENGLLRRGDGALDYLLDPRRYPTYRASPNVLINVFRLLLATPEASTRPQYEPFLKHWLDPENAPADTPGSGPAEQFRIRVFALFTRGVQPWVVPYCEAELDRKAERETDLRKVALAALLHLGRTEAIVDRFDALPPNEAEPNVHLRQFVLFQLRSLAMPGVPEERRDGVRKFDPLLRRALKAKDLYTRMNAASTLLRLGDSNMVDYLLALSVEAQAAQNAEAAWSALLQLSEDSDDPRLRARAETRILHDPRNLDFTYSSALQILAIHWIADAKVRAWIWNYVHAKRFEDLRPIRWLSRYPEERGRIVETLRKALHGDDSTIRQAAVRFATNPNFPLPELMPDVLNLARDAPRGEGRSRLLSTLVAMRFRPVIPMLTADLEEENALPRSAAAAGLLEFGEREDVAAVARRLDEKDLAMLGPLLTRARAQGRQGVPESLLAPLLRLLESAANEQTRQRVLFILRCRGTLEGVEEGLMDAYRREPSSRIADAIRATTIELAHAGQ